MLKKYFDKEKLEAGVDEAGRGCLAGPVFAAAVILPPKFKNTLLNDSKVLRESQRNALREIIEKEALAWAVARVDHGEIDQINILNASIKAMHLALEQLSVLPEQILVDGNRFKPFGTIPYHCMVKGDARFMSIAAASVLAKTHRDEWMELIDLEFPQYLWKKNKGYPTIEHRKAIQETGPSPYHRMSFQLLDNQLKLDFTG